MKTAFLGLSLLLGAPAIFAQSNPAITSWLQNTTQTGSYYVSGNSTAIGNGILVNCQRVAYSDNWVYVQATGVPSYPTGPFLDNNPTQASNQNRLFRLPLIPRQNTGSLTATRLGSIGFFINGVAMFDFRDGVAWNPATGTLCGGGMLGQCPGGPNAVMDWNRDAVLAERAGFDCAKGHPARGEYHHHQNPSAFKLDLNVVSTICNLYDADGLYMINTNEHSPLIGFAKDGFPVYGAYAYKNTDGTGGIVRMKSGYQLRNMTLRTHSPAGLDVPDGPAVSTTYPLGYFREDYEFISHPGEPDYLNEHNGRFCVTPEYPDGTYAYFATVDAQHNSAYPYMVGPAFYGLVTGDTIASITESVTDYTAPSTGVSKNYFDEISFTIFPNPASDLIAIQAGKLVRKSIRVELTDFTGKVLKQAYINPGQTIAYFDVETVYNGLYFLKMSVDKQSKSYPVSIVK